VGVWEIGLGVDAFENFTKLIRVFKTSAFEAANDSAIFLPLITKGEIAKGEIL